MDVRVREGACVRACDKGGGGVWVVDVVGVESKLRWLRWRLAQGRGASCYEQLSMHTGTLEPLLTSPPSNLTPLLGADVFILYLNEHEDAAATRKMVEAEGRRCSTMAGDVRDPKARNSCVRYSTVLQDLQDQCPSTCGRSAVKRHVPTHPPTHAHPAHAAIPATARQHHAHVPTCPPHTHVPATTRPCSTARAPQHTHAPPTPYPVQACAEAVERCVRELGHLDILVRVPLHGQVAVWLCAGPSSPPLPTHPPGE